MNNTSTHHHRRFGPYAVLLCALVLYLAVVPFVQGQGPATTLISVAFSLLLIAGLGVTWKSRRMFAIALVLLVVNLGLRWFVHWVSPDPAVQGIWHSALAAGYLCLLIGVLLRSLSRQRRATLDTVIGGVNVYLMVALVFANLHLLIECAQPGSYASGGVALSDPASRPHGSLQETLLYFSFVVLTTLGFGDIGPVRPAAQFLCGAEAVLGQLFVAVFIGGLVALWIGERQGQRSAGSDGDGSA